MMGVKIEDVVLQGKYVRLEPLDLIHVEELAASSAVDPSLYQWKVLRVCFHTDVRNKRSGAALARIGGHFEGILRSHRIAADFIPRDSARFSILASEWSEVMQRLQSLLK